MAQISHRACPHCIWGTTHAVMVIFSTLMKNYNISGRFFHFLEILIFWAKNGVKRQKMAQNREKACPHCIWGTIHAVVVIYGTLLQNYNTSRCFFHFLEILILWAKNGVKGQKWPKSRIELVRTVSQELHMLSWWFLVHLYKIIIPPGIFFIFWKFWFCGPKMG